ncbi:hypothetical protein PQI07_31825 [Methylobacterium sp. 092160098-2]|uniref:hypothetical protein n=1 Tax=Methylobacterium sp. 092160098-2 TaxID=3025129 RepID=UPI002381A553|nr:hypothetical protein [Methylobacterium sp. 092160098-2]MDE4915194.1 hypothetical protein [Methylobacterium sp. 092160098-2]
MSLNAGNGSRASCHRRAQSPLVRRLVGADGDPAKQRILSWFKVIGDDELRRFGLSADDIKIIRDC